MNTLPPVFLQSLDSVEGFSRSDFVRVHEAGDPVTSIRINPVKMPVTHHAGEIAGSRVVLSERVPWSRYGFYLKHRPSFTFDPVFHAGCYYVQEASSMFLEQAFVQLVDVSNQLKVVDVCAAPGGKSTHILSLISEESLLVSNEIIKSRNGILVDNMIKWGAPNVVVTNNDPSAFRTLNGYFDVMVVDAPCSGSGLFRKDPDAINEWSPAHVQLCSQRQQRILADALPALKENGILVYVTCSYSKEEDEQICDWLIKELSMESIPLNIDSTWNIVETITMDDAKAYRFFPDKLKGEGLFMACFRKCSASAETRYRAGKPEKPSAKELSLIRNWLHTGEGVRKDHSGFFVFPESLQPDLGVLGSVLNVQYKGIALGQIMKERLVPAHALALSRIISPDLPHSELSFEEAILYLQRQEVNFNTTGKGWQLVRYAGHNLGWVNVLPNRINNYYPKELRILKQRDDSAFGK